MTRRMIHGAALAAMAPACVFWVTALMMALGVKLGFSHLYLGELLDAQLAKLHFGGSGGFGLLLLGSAIVFAGPILALMIILTPLLRVRIIVEKSRARVSVAAHGCTRWISRFCSQVYSAWAAQSCGSFRMPFSALSRKRDAMDCTSLRVSAE